jgi:peptidoglycan-associated lipoprotein
MVLGLAIFIIYCGGSKETSRIPEEYYESIAAEPESEPEAEPPPVIDITPAETVTAREEPATQAVIVFRDVHFDFDKYDLTENARQILAGHARILKDNALVKILIEGHCDERGTIEYNLTLGDRRAAAVRDYLVNYGIDPSRISTISYGEERPLDPRHDEEAWGKNRRSAFIIMSR